MKILITGVNGLVGNSLYKLLEESDHIVYSSSRNIEGLAKYKGKVGNVIYNLIGGLKSSMGYHGSKQIKYLRKNPQFVKITKAGFYESMVHNVDIVKTNKKY